jgi:hypothetical protein
MLARVAVALAALVLLAGCSSPSATDSDDASTPPAAAFTVTGDNRVAPPLFTDTYHFLALPDVTPTPPDAYEPVRVPVTTIYNRAVAGGAEPPSWDFALPQGITGLVGIAQVWVEVQGTVTGNPFSQYPTQGCFWTLDAIVEGQLVTLGCLMDDLSIEPGIYQLNLTFAHPDLSYAAGTEFHVAFTTGEWVERTPGSNVEVLTASVHYDSFLQIYGLQLPLQEGFLVTA